MNKVFDLNDQTSYEKVYDDFVQDATDDATNGTSKLSKWSLSLVDNGYPFATTGTDPILLGYEPTNAVIDIGSTYWFPTISKSVEPVAKLYNALEETLNQVVNAFTGGSGGTEFSGFMQSVIQVMDNIMLAQLGAIVVGFITLIL